MITWEKEREGEGCERAACPNTTSTSSAHPHFESAFVFFLLFFDEQALTKITGLPAAAWLFSVVSEGSQRGAGRRGCLRRPSIGSRCIRTRGWFRWSPMISAPFEKCRHTEEKAYKPFYGLRVSRFIRPPRPETLLPAERYFSSNQR